MRMKTISRVLFGGFAVAPLLAFAFESGSTGADGAFTPAVSQEVELPPSGVFNFTNVNIPSGVAITFKKNTANTPVVILATGDVNIAGTVNISGSASAAVGAGGDGSLGDDGLPGRGGPGGFDGGAGGLAPYKSGGDGQGPGGGGRGGQYVSYYIIGGGGGGFAGSGANNQCYGYNGSTTGTGGASYGSSLLLPLIGGSGGGGATGGGTFSGSGGGGGGGAILIAASGTVAVTGAMLARGGASGATGGGGKGALGGGGAGGAIRIVATSIAGNGGIDASGGGSGDGTSWEGGSIYNCPGGAGSGGRIRLEAETITRTAATAPAFTVGAPGSLFVAGLPSLAITSVAGVNAPANPTGNADITLPADTANPVTVTFATTGVPVGNTVKLTVKPAYGAPVSVISPAITGSTESGAASVTVNLPAGPSVLQAETTYTIVVALGEALSQYANNERVEKITLSAALGKPSTVTLITVNGNAYEVPAALLASMGS